MSRLGEDFHVNLRAASGSDRVDGVDHFFRVLGLSGCLIRSNLAIKVPEIDPFRQPLASLTFHVLPDIIFDAFENAWILVSRQ